MKRNRLLGLAVLVLLLVAAGFSLRSGGPLQRLALNSGLTSIKDSPLRRAYEADVAHLCDQVPALRQRGLTAPDIARKLHGERRALGERYKDMTPQPLRDRIYEVNRRRYGDPLGPSFAYLERRHARDGGPPDYEAIIAGACRPNRDVNALLR